MDHLRLKMTKTQCHCGIPQFPTQWLAKVEFVEHLASPRVGHLVAFTLVFLKIKFCYAGKIVVAATS